MRIKRCLLSTLALLSLSAWPSTGQLQRSGSQLGAPQSVVTPHPITITEILALRKPSEVHISPDGARVAYVVTQAVRESNQDHAVLYVADAAHPGPGRALANGIHINTVRWSLDGRWIFFVSETESGRDIWQVPAAGGQPKQVTAVHGELVHTVGFEGGYDPYRLSPDGTTLLYAAYDTGIAKREYQARIKGGAVYKGESIFKLTDPKWLPVPYELWSYDLHRRRAQKLWETPMYEPPGFIAPEFQISPDGKKVALLYQSSDDFQDTLALLDLINGKVSPLLPNLLWAFGLHWSDDGQSLVFESTGEYQPGKFHAQDLAHYTFSLTDRTLKPDKEATLAALTGQDTVTKAVEQKTGDLLHNCSLDSNKTRATCIEESPMLPPEVVSVALNGDVPEGKPLLLTHLNPEYDAIQLGQISALSWSEKKGEAGQPQAGLILPVNYVPGQRYPLVVILYNVYSGREFIAQASLFNYPAQAFAGHGYAVLLMNLPEGILVFKDGDFESAKATEVDGMVSAVRSAVDLLVARGIADPKRMGIMGWSYGAWCTDYIVTHYPAWFQAAASGEGDNHNPGLYWLGDDVWRAFERSFYGGGPYGKYYPRWKAVAPVLNVDRLRVPLLMEYTAINLNALEMRSAILEQGGETELVFYPDDEHVFLRPLNRYNSMMRHFDWFNFWLLGEEDPDPAKAEQYARWRELRKLQEENEKKAPR